MFIFWLKHKVLPKFPAAEYDTHFRATLRGKPAGSIEHTVVYPPNGVIPFHGFAMFCAPFCYVYDDTIQLYLCKYMAATFFIVNFFWVSSSACSQIGKYQNWNSVNTNLLTCIMRIIIFKKDFIFPLYFPGNKQMKKSSKELRS